MGAHFKNTVLDVCSNQGHKREMWDTDFKWGGDHHWPPLATALTRAVPPVSNTYWLKEYKFILEQLI